MPLINIKSLILIIVAILNLLLGAFVYLKNRKDKINIYYGLTASSTAAWCFGIAVLRLTNNVDTAFFWVRFNYVAATLIGISFLSFSLVFPFVKEKPKKIYKTLFLLFAAFVLFISAWPNLMVVGVEINDKGNTGILTEFVYFFATYFMMCLIGAFGNFIQKYKDADSTQKVQIKYVFTGTLIAAIFGTTFDLILPIARNWELAWLGPIFTIVMVGLIAYAVLKHHLMNIKVILTEFLIGIMGIILLVFPFLMPTNILKILAAAVFLLFCVFGYYLIKATYEQARRKEEAQKTAIQERFSKEEALWTARQLQRFNETLEQSVKLRTKELEEAKNTAEQKAIEAEKAKNELEKFYQLTVGREIKMGELKGKIKEMEKKLEDSS